MVSRVPQQYSFVHNHHSNDLEKHHSVTLRPRVFLPRRIVVLSQMDTNISKPSYMTGQYHSLSSHMPAQESSHVPDSHNSLVCAISASPCDGIRNLDKRRWDRKDLEPRRLHSLQAQSRRLRRIGGSYSPASFGTRAGVCGQHKRKDNLITVLT